MCCERSNHGGAAAVDELEVRALHETLLGIVNAADAASDEEFVLEGSQDSAPESSVIAIRR